MMRSTFVQKLLAVTALVASTAISSAIAQSDENGGKRAAGERVAASQAVVVCDGGAQEAVFTNTQNLAASTASTIFAAIPNTTLPGGGSGDSDLYTVTFSGEADGTVGGNWEIQAQVSVNFGPYTAMNPVGPDTFHTGTLQGTHTMTWCRRLTASNTNFRVVWRKNGGGSAIVDDYLMRVERSN
jgi:hypothetical protein